MSDNLKLWNSVLTTDPAQVKPITGKTYQGNSPKPYWLIQRATEIFGPIGIGWGVVVKSERFERMSADDVLHVATVSVWYEFDGKRSETFDQMGGTKAAYRAKSGNMIIDEDAGKKSVTDGMVKCLSMIGFAGDIFSGMWDDSKYVEWAAAQYDTSVTYLTDDQAANIDALITETKSDKKSLLGWVSSKTGVEVNSLKNIPSNAYEPIIKHLEKKRSEA